MADDQHHAAVDDLIHAYLSDGLDEAGCARLQAALTDPAVQQAFLAAASLEGGLRRRGAVTADEAERVVQAPVAAPLRFPLPAASGAALLAAAAVVLAVVLTSGPVETATHTMAPNPGRQLTIRVDGPTRSTPIALALRNASLTASAAGGHALAARRGDRPVQIQFLAVDRR